MEIVAILQGLWNIGTHIRQFSLLMVLELWSSEVFYSADLNFK